MRRMTTVWKVWVACIVLLACAGSTPTSAAQRTPESLLPFLVSAADLGDGFRSSTAAQDDRINVSPPAVRRSLAKYEPTLLVMTVELIADRSLVPSAVVEE